MQTGWEEKQYGDQQSTLFCSQWVINSALQSQISVQANKLGMNNQLSISALPQLRKKGKYDNAKEEEQENDN